MLTVVLFSSFKKDAAILSLQKVEKQMHDGLEKVYQEAKQLKKQALALKDNEQNILALREQIKKTRLAYKQVEFLIDYFDSYNVKKNINGAPLPSVEPNVPEVVKVEPTGLQVLDELIFSDELYAQKDDLIGLTEKFEKDFHQVKEYQSRLKLTHRHVFEASRQQLIRIFTLGLTGFDTPGSVNAVAEAEAAIEGIYKAIDAYMPLMTEKSVGYAILMDAHMTRTRDFFKANTDFDSFDRLKFLKQTINPQYEILLSIHTTLGIEFANETNDLPKAVNYQSKNLFDKDFLNVGYFANQDLENPHLDKRIALGKLLFFDPLLSKNNKRACASCHQPEKAFTDGVQKSIAMNQDQRLQRNSPTLVNSVFAEKFFLDGREPRLEKQMLHVLEHPDEFDTDFVEVIGKLNKSNEYIDLFAEAYPDLPKYTVSTHTISDALSTYVMSLVDYDSDFDKYVRGEYSSLDPAAYRGFNLFMGKAACGTCHFAPNFNGTVPPNYMESETEVLGIPTTKDTVDVVLDPDLGRYASKLPRDKADFYKHSFKTVTVRNVALTAPYMHNGVYDTLEEVVDFYNRGGGAGMGMDLPHQTLPFDNLTLTKSEQEDIVAFMNSLTGDMSKFDRPDFLPEVDEDPILNKRSVGGSY